MNLLEKSNQHRLAKIFGNDTGDCGTPFDSHLPLDPVNSANLDSG